MSILVHRAEFQFLDRNFFRIKNVFGFGSLHHSMFVQKFLGGYYLLLMYFHQYQYYLKYHSF